MFGLFNKSEKISSEISTAAMQPVLLALIAKDPDAMGIDGNIDIPYGFWLDEYIQGFVFAIGGLFIDKVYNGSSFSREKKGEIMYRVSEKICGGDALAFIRNCSVLSNSKASAEFNRGINDAATYFGAVFGIINPSDTDPIFLEAKERAASVYSVLNDISETMGTISPSSFAAIAQAVLDLTLVKHVEEKYK